MNSSISAALPEFARLLGPKGFSTDPDEILPWLTDWRGLYQGDAPALLSPSSLGDVSAIVQLAGKYGVALVPQGGNTSMVGGATPGPEGASLLLSMRRMNRIRSVAVAEREVVAEAGVILETLHERVGEHGLRFPLTLASKGSATIGGLTSTNAGGTQVLRHGTMRRLVCGIEAALPDGSVYSALAPLKKDTRGYDLTQLLIGAEGTLGIITAVRLTLVPAISDRAVAWFGLESPQAALALLRFLQNQTGAEIESFELISEDSLALVLAHIPRTRRPLTGRHRWHVLVEQIDIEGGTRAQQTLSNFATAALKAGLAEDAVLASSEAQCLALWKLRDTVSEAERASGPAIQHDISVPVADMPAFMVVAAREVEVAYPGVVCSAFGHLGDGNVHFHVRAPANVDAGTWRAGQGKAASAMVYDLVVAAGGSISAEHGIGVMKLEALARLGDPARLVVLRAIKHALDPMNLMNPGKLVPLARGTSPA